MAETDKQSEWMAPVCKGSVALGTACGQCERCASEWAQIEQGMERTKTRNAERMQRLAAAISEFPSFMSAFTRYLEEVEIPAGKVRRFVVAIRTDETYERVDGPGGTAFSFGRALGPDLDQQNEAAMARDLVDCAFMVHSELNKRWSRG